MRDRICVLVHADDPVSRAGVMSVLRLHPDLRIVDDDSEGVAVAVVLGDEVDARTTQVVRAVQRGRGARVVLVVARLDDGGLLAAVEAGVGGLLRRSEASPDRLAAAVRACANGGGAVPGDLLGRLLDQVGRLQRQGSARGLPSVGLTSREVEVLRLVADGLDTSEIAHRLAYSERTIKNVIHDITSRFHLRNRSHAVAYACRAGLI